MEWDSWTSPALSSGTPDVTLQIHSLGGVTEPLHCIIVRVNFLIRMHYLPSLLYAVGWAKGIRPVKMSGGGEGGHCLVWMEWCPAGWSVCLPLLIFPCTIKSGCSLLVPAHPGGPGKRVVKWLWLWWFVGQTYTVQLYFSPGWSRKRP